LLYSPVEKSPKNKSQRVHRIPIPCNKGLRTTRLFASALEDLIFYDFCIVHCNIITKCKPTICTFVKIVLISNFKFHNTFYMYSFEPKGPSSGRELGQVLVQYDIFSFVNQSCASSGDSELGRVSSGWITSPSLSKFGGS